MMTSFLPASRGPNTSSDATVRPSARVIDLPSKLAELVTEEVTGRKSRVHYHIIPAELDSQVDNVERSILR